MSETKLSKQDKIMLLEIARQGYVTDDQKSNICHMLQTPFLTLRYVSTAAEIEELRRLDELRNRFSIEGDTDITWDNDAFVREVQNEIASLRQELKQESEVNDE